MHPIKSDERRQEGRVMSVLQVCRIETSSGAGFALVRNISSQGAQIEAEISDPIGSEATYSLDDKTFIAARIAWRKDGRIGLENLAATAIHQNMFPRRAVRIPLSLKGQVWIGGSPHQVQVRNISQSGVLLDGLPFLEAGTLLTLKVGRITLSNAVVRWSEGSQVGIKFARPLVLKDLNAVIAPPSGGEPSPNSNAAWGGMGCTTSPKGRVA